MQTVCDNAPFRRVARIDDQYTLCDKLIPAAEEKVNRNGELTLKCDLQSSSLNKIRCIWRLPDGITECEVRTYNTDQCKLGGGNHSAAKCFGVADRSKNIIVSEVREHKTQTPLESCRAMCPCVLYSLFSLFQVPDAIEEDDCYDSKCYCANDNTVRYLGNTREHNCNIRIEEANFDRHNGTWSCIAEGRFIDTVNVTVTTLTEAAVLGLAIGIPLTVLLILLIIILLICILCPAVCAVCLCCGGGGDKEDSRRRSLRRAEDDWPPSGLEGGRSRNVQPVQIVRTPQHAVRQESYQQRSSYPVYETPSNENDDDYYSR